MRPLPALSRRSPTRILLTLLAAALLATVLIPAASGATTAGATDPLVNAGQVIRDASSAVPVIGFNMTADTSETLTTVTVDFVSVDGFDDGDDQDLRALDVDAARSGVGLYRDDGAVDDALDAGDTPVVADDAAWSGGNEVTLDLSEPVPSAVTGRYHWFVVLRTADTADTLADGDAFRVRIEANAIVATSGAGTLSQPSSAVETETLTVRLTRGVDMVGGFPWIGPGDAAVTARAVLGLRVVDGGIATNRGIDDRVVSLQVRLLEEEGVLTSADLQPLDPDGSVSGLALYWDDGSVDDAWDAADAPVVLDTIAPTTFSFGGATFTLTPPAPGLPVPDAPGGALDLFLVVRTRDIVTGDAFRLQVPAHGITVDGLLASQTGTVDDGLATPLDREATTLPSATVRADSTPPELRSAAWVEDSPHLFARGPDLYFGPFMTSPQVATAAGEARDDESGLARAVFSAEPGLAGSPPDDLLAGTGTWVPYGGDYRVDADSTDADSPAVVTVLDAVGNPADTAAADRPHRYTRVPDPLLLLPNPGWEVPPGTAAWVAPDGTLWFGDRMADPVTVSLTVDLAALTGAGLKNATASQEPGLAGGPRPGSVTYAPVPDDDTWTNEYDLAANSTDADRPVTLWAEDNLGNAGSLALAYRKDVTAPAVAFVTPAPFATLSGEVEVRVTVTEDATAVRTVRFAVDAGGAWEDMFVDGDAHFVRLNTALFPDGPHRLLVSAEDMVGNVRVQGLDVTFDNAVDSEPPVIALASPRDGAFVSGTVELNATASDAFLADFAYRVDAGPWVPVGIPLDTALLGDGPHALTLRATDAGGLVATLTVTVRVDNTDPQAVWVAPPSGGSVAGVETLRLFAEDANGVASVVAEVGGRSLPLTPNRQTGYYELVLDTRTLPDGLHNVTVTVTDASGRTATVQASLSVANHVPLGTRVLEGLQANAILLLIVVLVVLFGFGSLLVVRDWH